MFTGLIETTGTVLNLKEIAGGAMRLVIAAPTLAGRWKIGDSIAVNGVCLTAIDMKDVDETNPGRFAADLAQETVRRTTLTQLRPGSLVNLELPTPAGAPLGGHVVQGHVDGTGKLASLVPLGTDLDACDWRLSIELPPEMLPNVVPQGSITVDGISLTVASLDGREAQIAVIPHTYKSTNLRSLLSGSLVNLEADVLSKYADRRKSIAAPAQADTSAAAHATATASEANPGEWLTATYLMANGY